MLNLFSLKANDLAMLVAMGDTMAEGFWVKLVGAKHAKQLIAAAKVLRKVLEVIDADIENE